MSSAIACPGCRVRLKVAAPSAREKDFSCPRCGQVIHVPGQPVAGMASPKALLLVLITSVLVVGAGIVTAIVMTRTLPGHKEPEVVAPPPALESQVKESLAKESTVKENPVKEERPAVVKEDKKPQEDSSKAELDRAEKEKRSQDYLRWMIAGGTAFNSQKLPDALAAYQEALSVMPGDAAAGQKMIEVKGALEALAKTRLNDEKVQADLKKLLDQGNEALRKRQYAAALEIYKVVLQKDPAEAAAVKGIVSAQRGLAQDQNERKKQDDFQKHVAAGQVALKAGRYNDAIAEFVAAQTVLPDNVEAARLQREAEKKLAADKNRQDQKAAYDRLIDLAGASLRNQRYDEAIAAYVKVLQIVPDDAVAARGLVEARLALQNATLQYGTLMTRGNAAMRDFRFRDAIDAYREATRLAPADDSAARALRIAEVAFENRVAYVAAMKRGNRALANLVLDEAAVAFADALRIVPGDLLATAGLQEAQRGVADLLRRRKDADLLIQTGSAAGKQRKYAEAARAYLDALKLFPTHPQAEALRILYRYNDNMADGTNALAARRYQDAIRHFQVALVEAPNDPSASQGLARARAQSNKK